jgi:hypothetical protein
VAGASCESCFSEIEDIVKASTKAFASCCYKVKKALNNPKDLVSPNFGLCRTENHYKKKFGKEGTTRRSNITRNREPISYSPIMHHLASV